MTQENDRPGPHARVTYAFDGFSFDPATGQLAPATTDDGTLATHTEPTRLAPQPARLLTMLLEKDGALLSRDEIRAALWPDVTVDVDQGLHFCVRQIRAALGDRASAPRYIETLPRRGYRWRTPVTQVQVSANAPTKTERPTDARASAEPNVDVGVAHDSRAPDASATSVAPGAPDASDRSPSAAARTGIPRRAALIGLALGCAAAAGAWFWFHRHRTPPTTPRVRIAVMPFAPPHDTDVHSDTRAVATHLVAALARDPALAVIGPTTTRRFATGTAPLRDTALGVGADWILNARFAERDGGMRMLVELVRTSDGVHAWVSWFDDLSAHRAIADATLRETLPRVAAARPE